MSPVSRSQRDERTKKDKGLWAQRGEGMLLSKADLGLWIQESMSSQQVTSLTKFSLHCEQSRVARGRCKGSLCRFMLAWCERITNRAQGERALFLRRKRP